MAGFHFFNPVPLMKIVEVIGGLLTEPEVVDSLLALATGPGHPPVRAEDTPGFIVNHAGRGFGTEALRFWRKASPTLRRGPHPARRRRLPHGPFELLDLTGLDVSHPVMESIYRQFYEEPRFRPPPLTRQMLDAGAIGRKVGQGFYRYSDDGKKTAGRPGALLRLPPSVWLSQARPELARADRALPPGSGVTVESGDTPSDERALPGDAAGR